MRSEDRLSKSSLRSKITLSCSWGRGLVSSLPIDRIKFNRIATSHVVTEAGPDGLNIFTDFLKADTIGKDIRGEPIDNSITLVNAEIA